MGRNDQDLTLESKFVLYYDGTLDYFGKDHLPYAVIATIMLFLFTIMPISVLLLYQFSFFQKILQCTRLDSSFFQKVMHSLQGSYKDGTEPGTTDYRWFSAVDLISRFMLYIAFILTQGDLFFPLAVLAIILLVILLIVIQPYKNAVSHYTKIDVTFYVLLALFYVILEACGIASVKARFYTTSAYIAAIAVSLIPLIYMTCLSFHWIFSRRRFGITLMRRLKAWRRSGYNWAEDSLPDRIINPDMYNENNWEIEYSNNNVYRSGAGHIYTD